MATSRSSGSPAAQPAVVPGEDPTRVGGRRVVAAIIDVGILVVLYIVLFVVLSKRAPVATWVGRGSNVCAGRGMSCATFGHRYVDGPRRYLLQLISLAYLVGVFVLQRGMTGFTLGTRALGVVTVGQDGKPIGPLRGLGRSVAGIVDYLPCCLPIVGIATIFATTGHRRVGDMAAHSLVVERRFAGSPIVVPGLGSATAAPTPAAGYLVAPVPPAPPVAPTTPTSTNVPSAPTADAPGATATWPGAADTPGWAAASPPASPPEAPGAAAPVTPGAQPYSPPVPPAASAPAPGTPSASPPAPADPTQPQWDAERGAYIQWDQVGQRWMQFDQATQEWQEIR